MAEQSKLDVSKWYAANRSWKYTPALWFYYRMIEVACLDARSVDAAGPTDEALLARDWIARSAPVTGKAPREYVSFPECCDALGLDADTERLALLARIDADVDMDNDDAWARLDVLNERDLVDDVQPLFDAPRVVPALDQLALFA